MSQAIDIQLFLPAPGIATQLYHKVIKTKYSFILSNFISLTWHYHQNCPRKLYQTSHHTIFGGQKVSSIIWYHRLDISQYCVQFARVVHEAVSAFSWVNKLSTNKNLTNVIMIRNTYPEIIQLYLKDIVSLDTFSPQVKLIAKIKPVLNLSPDSLHSASHNGSEWGALEKKICLVYNRRLNP